MDDASLAVDLMTAPRDVVGLPFYSWWDTIRGIVMTLIREEWQP